MRRHEISDADRDRVRGLLPTRGPHPADRGFVNAVLYVAKTGIPWRDLPERFGNWNSVWRRFRRWAVFGVRGRAERGVVLDATTLANDTAADVLTGSAGYDWFLFDATRDQVTDLHHEAFTADLPFIND